MTTRNNVRSLLSAVEHLPFSVEIAGRQDLVEVARFRAASYGKHLPVLAAKLHQPEREDFELGCEVFVARSKLDGTVVGTLRTHANVVRPLPVQASLQLPSRFIGARLVETTRLCVQSGPGASVVRSALFKAMHQYCLMQKVDWMIAAGRRPVDRLYDSLLFTDVDVPGAYYPMAHAGDIPHRVMHLAPVEAQSVWYAAKHPLYQFAFGTSHPDINLAGAVDLSYEWACPDNRFEIVQTPTNSVSGVVHRERRRPVVGSHAA